MRQLLLFLILSISPILCLGAFKVDVSLVHKLGIDKGLVLVSEVHTMEIMELGHWIKVTMKNGPTLDLMAKMKVRPKSIGPSSLLDFWWELRNEEGQVIKEKNQEGMTVPLGFKHQVNYKDEERGQLIEVTLLPRPL